MQQEVVEAEGHLIDSHLMERIFDTVVEYNGKFDVEEFRIGRTNADKSYLRLRVETQDPADMQQVLSQLLGLGCTPADTGDADLITVDRDCCAPEDFYSTTNHRTLVRHKNQWIEVANQRMDAMIVMDGGRAACRRLRDLRKGDRVVIGMRGIRVEPESKERDRLAFAFMSNEISSERQLETAVRQISTLMAQMRAEGKKIVVVAGPVVVHTGGAAALASMIRGGWVQALLAGNALGVHDIESALLGTSLGVRQSDGRQEEHGHRNHMRAINTIYRAGGIAKAVESGKPVAVTEGVAAPSGTGTLSLFGDDTGETAKKVREHLETAKYSTIETMDALESLMGELEKAGTFAFDTETTGVDTLAADLVGISVAFKEGEAYYIPVGHTQGTQLDREHVIARIKPVWEDPKLGKVGHNIKFDYEMLRKYGVKTAGIVFDTMIAGFLLNSAGRSQSLDDMAFSELGIEMIPISELIGADKKTQKTFDTTLIETATTYAAEDADMSWRLYERLREQLKKYGELNEYGWSMERLAAEIEWPIIGILGEMELAGIELDVGFLKAFGEKLSKRIGELKGKIYDLAGEEFNLGSPVQMGQILYGRLGLTAPGIKKGKTGLSTAASELEKMRSLHPIVELIMQFREMDKLQNTYVVALPEQVAADGRVHTSFSQAIVASGRLSSNNPNLQNIPVRTELGREIRTAFVAPKGRVLVSADYSQIELRVAAAMAGDEDMMQTFRDGLDLHQETAAELYAVPLEDVTKEMRSAAKTINFGVLYGMSAHGLSVATGMDMKQAGEFIERYFQVRPKLREFIEKTKKMAYDELYTATIFGRRRPCPEIRTNNFMVKQAAERVAVNVPIQGTAADIYKMAMIEVAARLDPDSKLLLQIHDELIVEAPAEKGDEVAALMKETMEGVIDLGVPLSVDTAVGVNWGEL